LFNGATVDLYALQSELGSAGDHIVPLGTDEFAETDPITDWPEGISEMPTADDAGVDGLGWHDESVACVVQTNRIGSMGHQIVFFHDLNEWATRAWIPFGIDEWTDYNFLFFWEDYANNPPTQLNSSNFSGFAEADAITAFEEGVTLGSVTGAANWGPNTGETGHLVVERVGSNGKQTFHQYSNATSYERTYTGGAWGAWSSGGGWTAVDASTTVKGITKLSTAPASATDPIAVGDNDGRVPSQGENDALQGTSGTPSNTNRYVTDGDARNTNARTPTAHSHVIADLPVADDAESNANEVVRSNDSRLSNARTPSAHASSHAWGGSDPVRPSVRAVQTIAASGEIAVGSDEIILVTATADRTGITVAAGAFDGQSINIVNRSAFSLTFNATESTSRVVGGGALSPASRSLLTWDADYGGAGVGRWVRLPKDDVAAVASLRTLGTGATQAAAGNDSRLSDARTPSTREWEAVFYEGDLASLTTPYVGIGKYKLPSSGTPTITEVTISCSSLPASQNLIADVNSVNNSTNAKTSLYTTQGNRPQIAPGGNYSNVATLPNTTQPGQGVEISVDVDQKGTGQTGMVTVIVRGTY
jgi:hypothetical protein